MRELELVNEVGQKLNVILIKGLYSDGSTCVHIFYKDSEGVYKPYESLTCAVESSGSFSDNMGFIHPKYHKWVLENGVGRGYGIFGLNVLGFCELVLFNEEFLNVVSKEKEIDENG